MNYQVLISAMNSDCNSICKKMNINSDAIIVNQCNHNKIEIIKEKNHLIKCISLQERGVGLSRNTAFMRADADIIEFADEDMIFTDTYHEDVISEFYAHPEADAILFNINSLNENRPFIKIKKFSRVSRIEALKYGCARLAIKREKVIYNNISFSLLFGGGAKYGSGEDTIFLQDCIKAGMKVYKSPIKIADVKQDKSTWFNGYTDKYYFDKGALFAASLNNLKYIYALFSAMKNGKDIIDCCRILKLYFKGIRDYEKKCNE